MSNEFQGIEGDALDAVERGVGEVSRYLAMSSIAAARGLEERAQGYREHGARVLGGILRLCATLTEAEEDEAYTHALSLGLAGLSWDDFKVYRNSIADHRDLADVFDAFAQSDEQGRSALNRYLNVQRRRYREGEAES